MYAKLVRLTPAKKIEKIKKDRFTRAKTIDKTFPVC